MVQKWIIVFQIEQCKEIKKNISKHFKFELTPGVKISFEVRNMCCRVEFLFTRVIPLKLGENGRVIFRFLFRHRLLQNRACGVLWYWSHVLVGYRVQLFNSNTFLIIHVDREIRKINNMYYLSKNGVTCQNYVIKVTFRLFRVSRVGNSLPKYFVRKWEITIECKFCHENK